MTISPGGRPADASPVGTPGGRQNWVDKAGGLPRYMRMIAHALMRKGMSESHAIAAAHETLVKLAATSKNPHVKAAAAAAIAEFNAKRASSHMDLSNTTGHVDVRDLVDLSATAIEDETIDLAPGDYRKPYDWKHGFIPLTPAAAAVKAKKGPNAGKGRAKAPRGVNVAGRGKVTPGKPTPAQAARVAKAKDDAARGRGVPGEVQRAEAAASKPNPVGKDFRSMTNAEKIAAVERMHGTGSAQAKRAREKWAPPSRVSEETHLTKPASEVKPGDVIVEPSIMGGPSKRYQVDKAHAQHGDNPRNVDVTDLATGRQLSLSLDPHRQHTVERKGRAPEGGSVTDLRAAREERLKARFAGKSDHELMRERDKHVSGTPEHAAHVAELTRRSREKANSPEARARQDAAAAEAQRFRDMSPLELNKATGSSSSRVRQMALDEQQRRNPGTRQQQMERQSKQADAAHRATSDVVKTWPVGQRVRAGVPGSDASAVGKVVGHTPDGMLRVEYVNHRGEDVTGTFNPSHARKTSALPGRVDARTNKALGGGPTDEFTQRRIGATGDAGKAGHPSEPGPMDTSALRNVSDSTLNTNIARYQAAHDRAKATSPATAEPEILKAMKAERARRDAGVDNVTDATRKRRADKAAAEGNARYLEGQRERRDNTPPADLTDTQLATAIAQNQAGSDRQLALKAEQQRRRQPVAKDPFDLPGINVLSDGVVTGDDGRLKALEKAGMVRHDPTAKPRPYRITDQGRAAYRAPAPGTDRHRQAQQVEAGQARRDRLTAAENPHRLSSRDDVALWNNGSSSIGGLQASSDRLAVDGLLKRGPDGNYVPTEKGKAAGLREDARGFKSPNGGASVSEARAKGVSAGAAPSGGVLNMPAPTSSDAAQRAAVKRPADHAKAPTSSLVPEGGRLVLRVNGQKVGSYADTPSGRKMAEQDRANLVGQANGTRLTPNEGSQGPADTRPGTASLISDTTVRKMSDDQLEKAFTRLFQAGGTDTAAIHAIEKELDRRDAQRRAEGNGRRR